LSKTKSKENLNSLRRMKPTGKSRKKKSSIGSIFRIPQAGKKGKFLKKTPKKTGLEKLVSGTGANRAGIRWTKDGRRPRSSHVAGISR
jgi:hypothetical protein